LNTLINHVDERVERLEQSIHARVESVVNSALDGRMLSDDERRWVRLAIQSEGQRAAFRRAVIEKTLQGLIWAAVLGLLSILWRISSEWIVVHFGFRP
jgi:hypothetical protein